MESAFHQINRKDLNDRKLRLYEAAEQIDCALNRFHWNPPEAVTMMVFRARLGAVSYQHHCCVFFSQHVYDRTEC